MYPGGKLPLATKHVSGFKLAISLTISYYFGRSRQLYMNVVSTKKKRTSEYNERGLSFNLKSKNQKQKLKDKKEQIKKKR